MYKFVSSYKHKFCYEREDGSKFTIMGDIYRDVFKATMTQEDMDYFMELDEVEVYEGEL